MYALFTIVSITLGWASGSFNGMPHSSFWTIFLTPLIDLHPITSFSWEPEMKSHKYNKNSNWPHLEWGPIVKYALLLHHDSNIPGQLCSVMRVHMGIDIKILASLLSQWTTQATHVLPTLGLVDALTLPGLWGRLSYHIPAPDLVPAHLMAISSNQEWFSFHPKAI